MFVRRQETPNHARQRRGLAPVELVLSIPPMMMLLALMIVIGTAGSWKLRTQTNSRQAAYRSIWPRTGASDPKPDNWWPKSATMSFRSATPAPFQNDPFAQYPVVRGPMIGSPRGGTALRVIDKTLDMTRGMNEGYAEIDRDLPLFRRLDFRNHYQRSNQIFADQQWQHGQMGISNYSRRIPVTYQYDMARVAPGQASQMMAAVNALMSYPGRQDLFVLDRDDEIRPYWGDLYYPYTNDKYDQYSAYPAAAPYCNLSGCRCSGTDLRTHVDNLIDRVKHVPNRLCKIFLDRYYDELNRIPPPSEQRQEELMQKIQQIKDFQNTLPP